MQCSKALQRNRVRNTTEKVKETKTVSNIQNNTGRNTDYLKQLLPPRVQEQTRYSLRNPSNFIVPVTRRTFHFNSYLPSSLREWNSLNAGSRNSSSIVSFKRTLSESIFVPPHFYTIQTSRIGHIIHIHIRLECMGCRFTIYSLFMDIQNSFLDIQKSIYGYPKIHFWISKIS